MRGRYHILKETKFLLNKPRHYSLRKCDRKRALKLSRNGDKLDILFGFSEMLNEKCEAGLSLHPKEDSWRFMEHTPEFNRR